jgi:uncharacterized protein (DUF433 family)
MPYINLMDTLAARITTDPKMCGGKPCIRNMRIRVSDLLELLAAGETRKSILKEHEELEDDDISAALECAAKAVSHPVLAAK